MKVQVCFSISETARKWIEPLLILCVVFAFTWNAIGWSSLQGKLAFPPDYDDSHSLVEGALRWGTWQEAGWIAAWQEYRERIPHSFLHFYYTALLFAAFGVEQAVPYWANALFLAAVLLAFASLLPPVSLGERFLWMLAFLGMPVCFHLVHDFRSEVTMAALLFVACALTLQEARGCGTHWWRLVGIGLIFALALGVKPAMFPYAIGMLGLCSIVLLAGTWLGRLPAGQGQGADVKASFCKGRTDRADGPHGTEGTHDTCGKLRAFFLGARRGEKGGLFWQWLVLWGMAILPVLPHFVFNFNAILSYILRVVVESDAYHIPSEMGAQWSFHWLGYSGVWHLGGFLVVLPLVVGAWLLVGACFVVAGWWNPGLFRHPADADQKPQQVQQAQFASEKKPSQTDPSAQTVKTVEPAPPAHPLPTGHPVALAWVANWHYYLPDWSWFALVFLMVGAFAGIAINAVEQPFFGMTFQLLLVASGISGLAWVGFRWPNWPVAAVVCSVLGLMFWQVTLNRNFLIPAAGAGALVAGGCWLARWPWTRWAPALLATFVALLVWKATQVAPFNNYLERTRAEAGQYADQGVAWRRDGPAQLWALLTPLSHNKNRPEVWFAGPGWIDGNTVGWEAVRAGVTWKLFNRSEKSVADPAGIPDSAEVVVLAEPGLLGLLQYPTPNVTAPLWQRWIAGDLNSAWSLIGEIQDPAGKKLLILRRKKK
jgi:hypothetical protein